MDESMNAGGPQGSSPPGAQLQTYREARGWTIEQVASQLNLAPRQIQAIERDDYAALPGMPIARGFVRAYAKLLKVDATPLLANMADQATAADEPATLRQATLSTPFSEAGFPSMAERRLKRKYIAGVMIVVALLAAVWAMQRAGILPDMPALNPEVKEKAAAPSGPAPDVPEPAPASPGDAAGPDNAPGANAPGNAASETATSNTVPDASASSPSADVPKATAKEDTAIAGKDALVLKIREDSWVEIKNSSNRTVFAQLSKAGTTETFEVKEPLSLVIGNAAGVDVTLRGSALEPKASARSNVARLNVK